MTPEQTTEFENIMRGLKGADSVINEVRELAKIDGGLASLKQIPELLQAEKKRGDELASEVTKLRKLGAARGQVGVKWVGGQPFVTDECALAFAGLFMVACNNKGIWNERSLGPQEEGMQKAAEWLGVNQKTALSGTEIPLPTVYVPQVVELVFAYGAARQYATVFPLGAGSVNLPRLKAGEDDFGYLGVGTAGMSQAVGEKRVSAENVTFTPSKFGGIIRIPAEIEQDTFIPLGQFLARYIARQFAKMEDKTLFIGDGTSTYANITGVGPYCAAHTDYLLQLGAGKTKPSDITLSDLRDLRSKVSAAILGNMAAGGQTSAAYYLHPTFESLLAKFNTSATVIPYRPQNGSQPATLDGFPIRWIGVSQAYQTTAAASKYCAFFGDLSYWYIGERGQPRVEVSREVYFATDELGMRALERIDVEAMAVDAIAALQLAAA